MHISTRSDYSLRVLIELARASGTTSAEHLASAQSIPRRYLDQILSTLKRSGFLTSVRGSDGGYRMARDPATITVAEVMRAVDGPITTVRGESPQYIKYLGSSLPIQAMWSALQVNIDAVLTGVTIGDLADGVLPDRVQRLAEGVSGLAEGA